MLPVRGNRIGGPVDLDQRPAGYRAQHQLAWLETHLPQRQHLRPFLFETLEHRAPLDVLLLRRCRVQLLKQPLVDLTQVLPRRDRRQLLQPNAFPSGFHPALVVPCPWAGEARLEQIMARQRLKASRELSLGQNQTTHGRCQIVVHQSVRHTTEVLESTHVPIEERHLIGPLIQPGKVAPRVHEPHHEHPHPAALTVHVHHHIEEVHLRFVAGSMHQGHVHLGTFPPVLAKPVLHRRNARPVAFSP